MSSSVNGIIDHSIAIAQGGSVGFTAGEKVRGIASKVSSCLSGGWICQTPPGQFVIKKCAHVIEPPISSLLCVPLKKGKKKVEGEILKVIQANISPQAKSFFSSVLNGAFERFCPTQVARFFDDKKVADSISDWGTSKGEQKMVEICTTTLDEYLYSGIEKGIKSASFEVSKFGSELVAGSAIYKLSLYLLKKGYENLYSSENFENSYFYSTLNLADQLSSLKITALTTLTVASLYLAPVIYRRFQHQDLIPIAVNNFTFERVKTSKIFDRKWHCIALILYHLRSKIYRQFSRSSNVKLFTAIGITRVY